ncbi:tRNA synthetases class I-domain-containing protein [Rhizophagus diaphanus]|nr:tRNA synthetases class I-domain-containing protein [Rhizophagus diaphanus] [Rhizophagus sp. MUCL 43196]
MAENNPKEMFILHDGPPYANESHALNKILKDIINRYKVLHGYKVNYIPGWDCHGLPIELKALKELGGVDKSSLTSLQIRDVAKKSALEALEIQRKEFISWGIMGDWKNPYRTLLFLDKEYEVRQLQVFHNMMKKGYIYRQDKPVYWSPSSSSSRTALAEAELEYCDNHQSNSVYVKLPVINSTLNSQEGLKDNLYILIWTTTPWTLPANQAVAINPNIEYSIVCPNNDILTIQNNYMIATKRLDALQKILGTELNVKFTFKATYWNNLQYIHPISEKQCKIIDASHITEESGTGLVHTAPGHGMEDYEAFDEFGIFTSEVGESTFEGKLVLTDGTLAVIEYLKKRNTLIKEEKFKHKYPYDWRTKKPIILRATPQWFANVEAIKQRAIELLEDVKMVPRSARYRLEQFTLSRSEWCISRQRSWGVPIPVFYESETDVPLLTDSSVEHIIEIFKKHGSDGWWKLDDQELLASEYKNNGKTYRKGNDTMDVWFDSGFSWTFILEQTKKKDFKTIADLYLEGSDQHRGWFQSSLLTAVAINDKAPYSTSKNSKSLGNVINPSTNEPAYGVDWVASSEYVNDINIEINIMSQVGENIRKYRNTARFMLGNLNNFKYNQLVEYEELDLIDKYMLHETYNFGKNIKIFYDEYAFNKVVQALNNLSNVLLYADHITSQSRRNVLTVLYHILNIYTISLSPIVPYLAEEIYDSFKSIRPKENDSVFKLGWYDLDEKWNNQLLQQEWNTLKHLRGEVNQLLEAARKDKLIKSSLEANVELYVNSSELLHLLQNHDLKSIFITSDATISSSLEMIENISNNTLVYTKKVDLSGVVCKIIIKRASLFKCSRCWNYNAQTEGELYKRCENVLEINK